MPNCAARKVIAPVARRGLSIAFGSKRCALVPLADFSSMRRRNRSLVHLQRQRHCVHTATRLQQRAPIATCVVHWRAFSNHRTCDDGVATLVAVVDDSVVPVANEAIEAQSTSVANFDAIGAVVVESHREVVPIVFSVVVRDFSMIHNCRYDTPFEWTRIQSLDPSPIAVAAVRILH